MMEFPNHFVPGISLGSRWGELVSAISRSDLALSNQLIVVLFIMYFSLAKNFLGG
jgi:hypothetical protein